MEKAEQYTLLMKSLESMELLVNQKQNLQEAWALFGSGCLGKGDIYEYAVREPVGGTEAEGTGTDSNRPI